MRGRNSRQSARVGRGFGVVESQNEREREEFCGCFARSSRITDIAASKRRREI